MIQEPFNKCQVYHFFKGRKNRLKTVISVNKHKIIHNLKHPEKLQPPVRVQRGSAIQYGMSVKIMGLSTVIYSPEKPLKCGARCWIETEGDVQLINSELDDDSQD